MGFNSGFKGLKMPIPLHSVQWEGKMIMNGKWIRISNEEYKVDVHNLKELQTHKH